jgi:hypothetical protein
MAKLNRILTWPLAFLILFCGVAFAATDVPSPDTDAAGWLKALYTALTTKAWTPLVGLVMIGLVYGIRRVLVPAWSWLGTALGGLVLSFTLSLLSTLGAAFAVGTGFSWSLVLAALSTAAAAAGIWEWLKAHIPGVQSAANKTSTPDQDPTKAAAA